MSGDDPVEAARREVLLIAYTSPGVPSELSGAFEQAVDELEAKVRAAERAALGKRLEALGEVDDWTVTVHNRLGKELRAVEQAAQGWDDLDALAAAWDDFIEGMVDEVVSAARALVEEARGGE